VDPDDEAPGATPAWPPPHPSPPLPPPREYGSPGTPPNRLPWLWMTLAVVVGVLVSVGLVTWLRGPGDDGAADRPDAGPAPSAQGTRDTESTQPPEPAPYRCWDGTPAQQVADCSQPTGEAGLRWVFPGISDERCAHATQPGGGAVVRILCRHVLGDGTRMQVGYYQWRSVRTAIAFFSAQDLEVTKQTGPDGKVTGYQWTGSSGGTVKIVGLFGQQPFSATFTMPAGTELSDDDRAELSSRPPDQFTGEPVG
jgi:hypothetical protein